MTEEKLRAYLTRIEANIEAAINANDAAAFTTWLNAANLVKQDLANTVSARYIQGDHPGMAIDPGYRPLGAFGGIKKD